MDAYAIGLIDNANLVYTIATDPTGDHLTAPTGYALTPGKSFMDAYWTGVRFFREREHGFHFSAEATYLFGRIEANVDKTSNGASADDDNSLNISAWGFEGFAGYTWNTATNPTVKGGVTYASGSDAGDLQNGNYHTFFTPAGEVHPRLGLMDLVDASNILAFNLGYTGSYNCHSWGVDLYHFELPEVDPLVDFAFVSQLAPAGDDLSKELGQEVDLWYNYQYSEHMVAQFAVAYFNAGDFIRDRNRCGVPFAAGGAGDCNPDTDLSDATSIRTNDAWRVYANLLVRF